MRHEAVKKAQIWETDTPGQILVLWRTRHVTLGKPLHSLGLGALNCKVGRTRLCPQNYMACWALHTVSCLVFG